MPQKFRLSYKFNAEQLDQLKQIVPEAFKDGMLDFNSLYDALSDYNEEDSLETDDNFYGLYWPGKRQAKRAASVPPRGTFDMQDQKKYLLTIFGFGTILRQ